MPQILTIPTLSCTPKNVVHSRLDPNLVPFKSVSSLSTRPCSDSTDCLALQEAIMEDKKTTLQTWMTKPLVQRVSKSKEPSFFFFNYSFY